MLVHLAPGLKAAAHARYILEAVFNEVCCGAQAAVAVVAIDDHIGILIRILDELLHVSIVQVHRAGNVRRLIRTWITDVDE